MLIINVKVFRAREEFQFWNEGSTIFLRKNSIIKMLFPSKKIA